MVYLVPMNSNLFLGPEFGVLPGLVLALLGDL